MNTEGGIRLIPLFDLVAELAPTVALGNGPRGERRMVPILSGSFEGSRLRGTILPGGVDWQIIRPDGVAEIEAHYSLQTEDGGHPGHQQGLSPRAANCYATARGR